MVSKSSPSLLFDINNPLLYGVVGKMNRAVDHIQEMDTWFKEWMDTSPWAIRTETNSKGVVKRLYFEVTNPIPGWAMLAAGDAIHNLRSALDHLAVAHALRVGKTANDVWFPIGKDATGFEIVAKDKLRKCSKPFRDFVANFKPYKGGNDLIFALHQLDLMDKHRVLIPIGAGTSVTIDADAGFYGAIDFSKTNAPVKIPLHSGKTFVEDGDTVINMDGAFGFPEKTEIRTGVTLSVVFNDATPLPGREIGTAIKAMCGAVEDIVLAAEPKFFR